MITTRNAVIIGLALLGSTMAACEERLADVEGRTVCTYVNRARVYDEDGNSAGIVVNALGGNTEICRCITREDIWDGVYDEWFNEQAYVACVADATAMGYPEANDCEYWYEEAWWVEMIQVPLKYENAWCMPE